MRAAALGELLPTLGGPDCLLCPAGEAGYDSLFFTELTDGDDPLSGVGVLLFSNPDELGLASRDLGFVDLVGVAYFFEEGTEGVLARLSSSLIEEPAMLCLLLNLSDCTLQVLLESSSPPQLFFFGVLHDEDRVLVITEGDWRLGGRLDLWPVGEGGLLSRWTSRRA